ncbi:MAG: Nudix-related transcriptional regulator NrtR [uncultured Solirubrobacteraceae bacterium]|uniref:Nudix-related transcriptional regulator NrtR n=1 Tax=uncultured Solirubrobacteraceae bacterium TaxID=1162706 RepID=A0A6J4RNN6_9ACTN|nr:MAG: Nudix-related transcriptional regulator NrtR [uncultured Solirubrobacteraceae bacterium]
MTADSRPDRAAPVVNCVVLRAVGRLEALLWQRRKAPQADAWALPGGFVGMGEPLETAARRHLLGKVGVRDVAHLEQLNTSSDGGRDGAPWLIDTIYLALVPSDAEPELPPDTRWHPVDDLPQVAFGHATAIDLARRRLAGKLSYSNIAFALMPPRFTLRELAEVYAGVLGTRVSPTHLGRVLTRDGVMAPTGGHRSAGRSGGRPAEEYAFQERELVISRPLAAFRTLAPAVAGR